MSKEVVVVMSCGGSLHRLPLLVLLLCLVAGACTGTGYPSTPDDIASRPGHRDSGGDGGSGGM